MIGIVSLNPAVDKYLRLPRLERGRHLHVTEVVTSAGGKGINVAGVLRALGAEVTVVGFFGGWTGDYILNGLKAEGIEAEAVGIACDSRIAFVVVDDAGTETEIVEPGGRVTPPEIAALRERTRRLARRCAVMALSGSVPPGCPDDIYCKLLDDCGRTPAIVDTSRAWLRAVVRRRSGVRPWAIKPNRREAEAELGHTLGGADAVAEALRGFHARGIARPLISDGARGLWAWNEGAVWRATPPRLQRVNSVGSGDAAVAGLALGLAGGLDTEATLRLAAACGAANVLTKECAAVRANDVQRLRPQIQVRQVTWTGRDGRGSRSASHSARRSG